MVERQLLYGPQAEEIDDLFGRVSSYAALRGWACVVEVDPNGEWLRT